MQNNLTPRIQTVPEKRFVGRKQKMSISENTTGLLWKGFMPRVHEIQNRIGIELYSIDIFPESYFEAYKPETNFEKWAAAEVSEVACIPEGFESITSPEGMYAIFQYKGLPGSAPAALKYIFGEWLPKSGFELDSRPHFWVMGEKYKNDDPNSEEELYIPLTEKKLID